jgi:hypothetical protein
MNRDRDDAAGLKGRRRLLPAAGGYLLLALVCTWPLPLHLRTHLLADPSTDVGVYVWNVWVFRHELLSHGHLPFSTHHVFAYTGGADFSLHNYTPIAGALATPLMGVLGVVGTFNVLLLAFMALTGLGTFVLARRLGIGSMAAWCAGALFVASPVMTARETQHFSLVIAAALPLFVWALLGALDRRRLRDAVLVGTIVAAAAYSDAYYPVYCLMMGALLVAARFLRMDWRGRARERARLAQALNVLIGLLGVLLTWRIASGTTVAVIGPLRIGLQTLYTPVFALTLAGLLRAWLERRPVITWRDDRPALPPLLRLGAVAVGTSLVFLTPRLLAIAHDAREGRLPQTELFWRSSPRGVDALAYVVPNPNHAWFGDLTRTWLMPPGRGDAFPEFVAAVPIAAVAIVALAGPRVLPRFWLAFTACFALLSLGPFIHVAGINTHVPGPWAFLRYVPVIGMARSPTRFAIVATLGLALLFAFALDAYRRRRPGTGLSTPAVGALTVALVFEITPAPRALYSAAVPAIYQLVRTSGDETGRLLELPTGIRDGTSSLGDFIAASEYYQTMHERPLIGGYLSRVSEWRKDEKLASPMLAALFELSEGREPSAELAESARRSRDAFLSRACVRFVVVDKPRASSALRAFAIDALRLTPVSEDASHVLLVPVEPPACS